VFGNAKIAMVAPHGAAFPTGDLKLRGSRYTCLLSDGSIDDSDQVLPGSVAYIEAFAEGWGVLHDSPP
jgi:hypothetical protein